MAGQSQLHGLLVSLCAQFKVSLTVWPLKLSVDCVGPRYTRGVLLNLQHGFVQPLSSLGGASPGTTTTDGSQFGEHRGGDLFTSHRATIVEFPSPFLLSCSRPLRLLMRPLYNLLFSGPLFETFSATHALICFLRYIFKVLQLFHYLINGTYWFLYKFLLCVIINFL